MIPARRVTERANMRASRSISAARRASGARKAVPSRASKPARKTTTKLHAVPLEPVLYGQTNRDPCWLGPLSTTTAHPDLQNPLSEGSSGTPSHLFVIFPRGLDARHSKDFLAPSAA